MLPLPPSLEMT